MRVAVVLPLSGEQCSRLVAAGLDVVVTPEADACPDAFRGADVAFGNPPAHWLPGSSVRWVQLESVGFGEYAGAALGSVVLTNLAGFFAAPVAETALAGLLALTRGIDRLVQLRTAGEWVGDAIRPKLGTLYGARVCLFGRGTIASRLQQLLAPFDCRFTSFGRGWDAAALDAALAESDVLVASAPHTPESRDTFHARRLALLPAKALVASVGRGSAFDEDALAAALAAGRLGGAVIDVTREEPLPVEHPFWTAPRLILTQHSGGGSGDEVDRKVDRFLDNLARYRANDPLEGVVDLSRGY